MLRCLERAENQLVREFFSESGYSNETLFARSRPIDIPLPKLLKLYQEGVPLEPSRLNTLVQWFWIGRDVDAELARRYVPDNILALFLKAGFLTERDGLLVSNVGISPFDEFLVVSDPTLPKSPEAARDTVHWPNPTTRVTSHLTMRTPVGRTLDLGTGAGVLALAAARHSEAVVATDINARAREFCLFNAALNGFDNIEFRAGDAYEPVSGERFDLIVVNAPFYITPSVRRVYSDSGMELDALCRKLAVAAVEHLNDRGCFEMRVEWVQFKGQPWQERLAGWFEGLGCDVWVLSWYSRAAAEYALLRVQDHAEETGGPAEQAALSAQWQEYFESKNVESIFGGAIVLRRKQGPTWTRMETLENSPMRPFGDSLRRVFDNCDWAEAHPTDEDLLASCPAVPESATLDRHFTFSSEGWQLAATDFRLSEGLPYTLHLAPMVADFVERCDGSRTLTEIIETIADQPGLNVPAVRSDVLWITRQMAASGMMVL
jgi:methylase of polypeptide subunit release factors